MWVWHGTSKLMKHDDGLQRCYAPVNLVKLAIWHDDDPNMERNYTARPVYMWLGDSLVESANSVKKHCPMNTQCGVLMQYQHGLQRHSAAVHMASRHI